MSEGKKLNKKEIYNNKLSECIKECHSSLLELQIRYESLITIIKFFQDNFTLFQDEDTEIIKVFNLGSYGIQFVTDVYYFAVVLEEEYKYIVLLNFVNKNTLCSLPYHKNTKDAKFNLEYIKNLIYHNVKFNKLKISQTNENSEIILDQLQTDTFKLRQTIMKNGNLNNNDCLLVDFFNNASNCFDLQIKFDKLKESCQDIKIKSLRDKNIKTSISYFKTSYELNFVLETQKLQIYVENIIKFQKTFTSKITTLINTNIDTTNTGSSDTGAVIHSALKKNTSSTKKKVEFAENDKKLDTEIIYVSENDQEKGHNNNEDSNTNFPNFESFLFAFGLQSKDTTIYGNFFSIPHLKNEIPYEIFEKFYKRFKFAPIYKTTFNKKEGPVSIRNLLRLRPEKWLADSLIDAFYSLLNRFEKDKKLPVEETAYFVKIEFLWGNHIVHTRF